MRYLTCLLVAAICARGATLGAQTARPAVSPATPSAPHERLAFFEGAWTVDEMPAAREFRERCAWLEGGRRHMVCRSRSKSAATGEWREGISMFSYRPADSTYLYYGLRPGGSTQTLLGRATADGEGWEFGGDEGTGTARTRTLVRIARLPGGRFRFVEQSAAGDAPFAAADTVHYRAAPPSRGTP